MGIFDKKYSDTEVHNQVQWMLRQSGKGYTDTEKMLNALAHDRRELLRTLEEIAEGDGNISLSEIQDQVEYYGFVKPHKLKSI